jgi:hypothetical protein
MTVGPVRNLSAGTAMLPVEKLAGSETRAEARGEVLQYAFCYALFSPRALSSFVGGIVAFPADERLCK